MDIKELSIGDWVCIGECGQHVGEIGRVVAISLESNYIGILTTHIIEECEDDVLPIPLTPEILEKNGFVKESEVGYERFEWRENGSVAIILNRNSFSKSETFVLSTFKIGINGWLLRIEHVHQLQHAIRLAGIDKEIKV